MNSSISPPNSPPKPEHAPLIMLRLPEVERRVGFKRATIYRLIAEGKFVSPVKMGIVSAWPEHEINAWLTKKVAARDARVAT